MHHFFKYLLNHQPLPLCTGVIAACCRTDTRICNCLRPVQVLFSRLRYKVSLRTGNIRCLLKEFIHILDFFLLDIDVKPVQQINRVYESFKINRHIILYV